LELFRPSPVLPLVSSCGLPLELPFDLPFFSFLSFLSFPLSPSLGLLFSFLPSLFPSLFSFKLPSGASFALPLLLLNLGGDRDSIT
jgi:hypothetical protein